jgi:hypothetical protein
MDIIAEMAKRFVNDYFTKHFVKHQELIQRVKEKLSEIDSSYDKIRFINTVLERCNSDYTRHRPDCINPTNCQQNYAYSSVQYFLTQELSRLGVKLKDDALTEEDKLQNESKPMRIVTPALKDEILFYICNKCSVEDLFFCSTSEVLEDTKFDFDSLNGILSQFQRFNFLKALEVGDVTKFILQVEAHDFANRGGFVMQEEILETNIKKLLLEVDNLKKQLTPDQLDTTNKISAIASAIFTGLGLLHK